MRPCPICLNGQGKNLGELSKTYGGPLSRDTFDLIHCSTCDAVYISPLPSSQDFDSLYRPNESDKLLIENNQNALLFYDQRLKALMKSIGKRESYSILEIGAGPAWLSLAAKRLEVKTLTVAQDITSEFPNQCPWVDKYIVDSVYNQSLNEAGPYDIISLTHVLPHLPEPIEALRHLKKLCRGLFFITGPHRPKNWNGKIESWRNYRYNHVPYHLQYMNASSISVAAKNSGLGLVFWSADSEDGESFEAWLDSPWPISQTISETVEKYRDCFTNDAPFKHVVIDGFLEKEFAEALLHEFPKFDEKLALNELGKVGGKAVNTNISQISPSYRRLFETLQSRTFLEFISHLTGIPDLILDPTLFGGGTHENIHGQELDPHVDFNYIDSQKLHRRLNLLIYLNKDWKMEWGGAIELHSNPRDIASNQIKSFNVLFNRAVIFETNEYSWHGFPKIDLPVEERHRSRKSISVYLYTKERPKNELAPSHSTFYVQRPLPLRFRPGYQLTPSDIMELQTLLEKRDSWIEQYQKQEPTRSTESKN